MRCVVMLFAVGIIAIVLVLVDKAGELGPFASSAPELQPDQQQTASVERLNAWFHDSWKVAGVAAAGPADELTVLRRLSLSLLGTIPSLEEIRSFEVDTQPDRIARWTGRMLQDSRFSDYFSERLARSLVGVESGPFIIFRRDRLTEWLSDRLREDTPWPETAASLIAAEGLWTDRPASNFITVAQISDDEGLDENKLAGRTVRTFLGQRIDCAQCHNHPFDHRWKQADFEGLAAFFSQARITIGGITDREVEDGQPVVHRVVDPGADAAAGRIVPPAVPFHPEWLGSGGTQRKHLADWVTHPANRRFERATANRIWALMFGRPWHDPVDDLPHPSETNSPDVLDLLGAEFRAQQGRLSSLIRLIAESEVFRLNSESPLESAEAYRKQAENWAVFPLVRLRPEQVIGSMLQAGSVRTIDQNSHPLIRLIRLTSENDFLGEYGDSGDNEFIRQVGTIPQALLRMNGRFTTDLTRAEGFTAPMQLLRFSPDDQALTENCFLTCLSRRPSTEEMAFFRRQLSDSDDQPGDDTEAQPDHVSQEPTTREQRVQDLFWALFNSPAFSWNH